MYSQRGLDSTQEQKSAQLVRDVRPFGQRISEDIFGKPANLAIVLGMMGFSTYYLAAISEFILFFMVLFFLIGVCRKSRLPFKMPQRSGELDQNDIHPGTGKPQKASGIYFFGNEKKTDSELWFTNEDMRTHVLIFGSTGSGKTETLVSLAFNALMQSSGFIYVDGKGDNSLFSKVFSMVRYMGREDDLLLINFMTGARDISGPQEKRMSNTMNPFTMGSSSMLSNLVVSMMDSSSSSGDGDMWKGRAIAFVEGLMKVLVAMRDAGHILLDAAVIRNYFGLDRIEAIVQDRAFMRDGEYTVSLDNLPSEIIDPLKIYLHTLPGYNKDKRGQQVSQVFEQHGFITMQLVRVFSSLADSYGHIMRTNLAEVDLKDVVLNRRILVVLLPALEKSPDELSNLGKVIISTLKVMMAAGLGDEVEGRYRDVIQRKPTNAATPFLCILDEYGYYAVKGFAVVPAQARSLGFSVIFAGQDLPAFQKASKEEAASIGANTNIKICMKLEDPQETWDFFNKTAGESYVAQVESFSANTASVSNTYMDNKSAKVEKRARIDLLDLKEQQVGEMHIFFKSKIVRAQSFFANPAPVPEMRLNQFLKVGVPKDADLYVLVKGIEDFESLTKERQLAVEAEALPESINHVITAMQSGRNLYAPLERGLRVVLDYNTEVQKKRAEEVVEVEHVEGAVNVFMQAELSDDFDHFLVEEESIGPLLDETSLRRELEYMHALITGSRGDAQHFSDELISDIRSSSHYSFENDAQGPSSREFAIIINMLTDHLNQVEKEEA